MVAYELLRAVADQDAYANLALPRLIAARHLDSRDAALATELGYGTLRAAGTLDEILSRCIDRPLADVDRPVLDLLRLGAYQALRTRIPAHAAVATTVDLARSTGNGRAGGFLNAVLRRVVVADWTGWVDRLGAGEPPLRRLALATAHPSWIAQAFADALHIEHVAGVEDEAAELERALAADDLRPVTHLVAWPGVLSREQLLAESGGSPGPWSPYAVRLAGGDPGDLHAIRSGGAAVQDEGSQLCAIALATATMPGPDVRWLDLCAGPGGKAALLAALAPAGVHLIANELHPHRAELVAKATARWNVEVRIGDARQLDEPAGFDRVLLDAPCSGLGALRRRPEARWRRTPQDVEALAQLQAELLDAAIRLVRPGGLVAYVACSPHLLETLDVVQGVVGAELIDARSLFAGVDALGDGPTVQLWPHRQGTDAMFFALLRRTG
jgi:16S rRNA (cytosine967-C5)-methyltransferase